MDSNSRIIELDDKELKNYLKNKSEITLMDLGQKADETSFKILSERIFQLLRNKYNSAYIGELNKTFENFTLGKCEYAKLTVQSFFKEYNRNMIQKTELDRNTVDRRTESIFKNFKYTGMGRALLKKIDLYEKGVIEWEDTSMKEIYDTMVKNGEIQIKTD